MQQCTAEQQKWAEQLLGLLELFPRAPSDEVARRDVEADPELFGLVWGRSDYACAIVQAYEKCIQLGFELPPLDERIRALAAERVRTRGPWSKECGAE